MERILEVNVFLVVSSKQFCGKTASDDGSSDDDSDHKSDGDSNGEGDLKSDGGSNCDGDHTKAAPAAAKSELVPEVPLEGMADPDGDLVEHHLFLFLPI